MYLPLITTLKLMATSQFNEHLLARLDEVQEELLYYPGVGVGGGGVNKMSKFLCDGQGAVRRAILFL